jgi:S-adenosyl-L-methionine hydrolase (adenosine-forming)
MRGNRIVRGSLAESQPMFKSFWGGGRGGPFCKKGLPALFSSSPRKRSGVSFNSMSSLITLTTDFGTRDGYVAQMKGVILGINPEARLIDATHDIESFDIMGAALVLKGLSEYFPVGAVHVAVVDPGVGSVRRGIVMRLDGRFYVGPDNGLFSLVFERSHSTEVREISNPTLFLPEPHPTFHGRDVFAPVAAHLSMGVAFDSVGPVIEDPVMLPIPEPISTETGIEGEVIYIERFGNLSSNIEAGMLSRPVSSVQIAGWDIKGIKKFFSEVPTGSPIALINSFGFLEIAVNLGNASLDLGVQKGSRVTVSWANSNLL